MDLTDISRHKLLGRAVSLLGQALAPRATVAWEGNDEEGDEPESGWVRLIWHTATHASSTRFERHVVVTDDPAAAVPLEDTVWVLAGRASSTIRDRLRERGTSFIHLPSGTVYLAGPGLLVDRVMVRSRESRRPLGGATVDPFADRASRVLRVLLRSALHTEPRTWGVRELAAAAVVDRTTTSRVLARLEGWKLVERARRQGGRGGALAVRLLDPTALLERWSASYDWTSNARLTVHAPIGNVSRFVDRLPEQLSGVRWALTLHAGAALLAPHAEWDRVHVYVAVEDDADLYAVAERRGWPAGDDGRLVLMRPHYRASLWGDIHHVQGRPVVGIAQLLLDLWGYPVRGREQAEHLLELRDRLPPQLFRTELSGG